MYRLKLTPLRGNKREVIFAPNPGEADLWTDLFTKYRGKELVAAIAPRRAGRSLDQNNLHWALLTILSFELEGNADLKDQLHEAQLEDFGTPKRDQSGAMKQDRHGRPIWKRSHEMTVGECARLIEGDFRRIAETGINGLQDSQAIRNYWLEWRQWRHNAGNDAETADEYRVRIPFCESCVLRMGEHIAHIVSRGAAPEAKHEPWNLLHLCGRCHLLTQHAKGWSELLTMAPHLGARVNAARKKAGAKELVA